MLGVHQVKKHIFGREVKRKRPLEGYETYATVSDPVVNVDYLKKSVNTVPHKMAIEQILLSSPNSSQSQKSDETENLAPEEVICNELKVIIIVLKSF